MPNPIKSTIHFTFYILPFTFYFSSCSSPTPPPTPAFYHWQTAVDISQKETDFLEALQVKKLYVKFFDVNWDVGSGENVPHAEVQFRTTELEGKEIIPTVFITNRALRQLPLEAIPQLGQRICKKIFELAEQIPDKTIAEVQLDCDWSGQTRDRYFKLLEEVNGILRSRGIQTSATIRLHQIKFREQTGVPPVDRGMLMFYNVGRLDDWEEENSILDIKTAEAYLEKLDQYPLELDLALPIFGWGVLFRQGRMIKLINNLRPADLQDSSRFHKKAANRFEVVKSTYLDGYYLYQGDQIRTEEISIDLLSQAVDLLKYKLPAAHRTLTFYHLDTTTIKHFSHEDLEALFLEMVQK